MHHSLHLCVSVLDDRALVFFWASIELFSKCERVARVHAKLFYFPLLCPILHLVHLPQSGLSSDVDV